MVNYGEIRTDCHFYEQRGNKQTCSALCDFYASDKYIKSCGNCPFFKTDEEYEAGWTRRFAIDQDRDEEAV